MIFKTQPGQLLCATAIRTAITITVFLLKTYAYAEHGLSLITIKYSQLTIIKQFSNTKLPPVYCKICLQVLC